MILHVHNDPNVREGRTQRSTRDMEVMKTAELETRHKMSVLEINEE